MEKLIWALIFYLPFPTAVIVAHLLPGRSRQRALSLVCLISACLFQLGIILAYGSR